ncbi:MAG TPA: DNA replication/repair protein RecF [Tepidimicrobium sp.]|nr:DNA replication/repair protein RecF [Tepidimicrobium sp.]
MTIRNIRLINFRNYNNLDIELNDQLNLVIGKNAQGKTNLLESIYISATGRSFRTNRDRELIKLDKREAYIAAKAYINGIQRLIEIKMEQNKQKRIKVNGIELKNIRELDTGLSVVIFSPDDIGLVKDGPSKRRGYLDMSISHLRPIYRYNLNRYNKVLLQRNNLLKSNDKNSNALKLLDIFDMQLGKIGTEIIISRISFLNKLSKISGRIHKNLTSKKEKLALTYISNVDFTGKCKKDIEESFLNNLKLNRKKDLVLGNTSTGPHRDDIKIDINGMDVRMYASQGQQRTIVLSIKLSEVEIIRLDKGSYPILLLDDVFSELDEERRKYLSLSLQGIQTVITSTDIANLEELEGMHKSIFCIDDGKLS